MNLHLEVVSDFDTLQTLSAEWWALFERCPAATPFQAPAWLLAWWRSFAPGRLHVICLRAHQRLVGIAPFYLEEIAAQDSAQRAARKRVLPLGTALSDYLDILLEPECVEAGLALLSEYIERTRCCWDEWEFPDLPPAALSRRLSCPEDCAENALPGQSCPVLDLEPGLNPEGGIRLRNAVPAHQLQNWRTARRRMERLGPVRVETTAAGAASERLKLLGDFLHARRSNDSFRDPRVVDFHRQAAPELIERKLLQICCLMVNERCVSLQYLLQDRNRVYSYLTAFDAPYAEASPGAVLLGAVIERSLERGATEFHFLRGGEAYKYRWGAQDRPNTRRVFESQRSNARAATHSYEEIRP